MPIELLTGKPGNAKTAFLVDRILDEGAKENPRPLFAMGINGLVDGLATVIDDPTKWAEITDRTQGPCTCPLVGGAMPYQPHTHRIPAGSLIFIDEAWKWFGHLDDPGRRATPKHVLDLAEHRHMGVDFVWTAQGPNQIFPFARPLIADHTHHVRRFGTQFVETFKWEELQEEVKSTSKRESSLRATKVIPKRTFGLYKSAQEHTIKRSIPWRVVAIPGFIIAAVLAGWLGYTKLRPGALAASSSTKEPNAALAASAPGAESPLPSGRASAISAIDKHAPDAVAEYYANLKPRAPTLAWSAPAFDDRNVVSDPRIFCVTSGAGTNAQGDHVEGGYTCMTEQGTRVVLQEGEAALIARWGEAYNPYRAAVEPQRADAQQVGGSGSRAAAGGASVASYGVSGPGLEPPPQGSFRGRP